MSGGSVVPIEEIGNIRPPPFVRLPDLVTVFVRRAERLEKLAPGHVLEGWLRFMVALSRAVGRKAALHMLLTGEPVDAATAQRFGLINEAVAPEHLDDAVGRLARTIAGKSPLTLAIGKEAFYRQAELDLEGAYAYASEVMTRNMMARDAESGIHAFLAKAPAPRWEGR